MNLHFRKPSSAFLAGVVLLAGLSCGGDRVVPTGPRLTPPAGNATLWDGSQTGGNPNVFFLPPLVASPVGTGNYGKSPFQSGLPVEIEIRCMPQPNFNCAGEGMGRRAMAPSQSDQQYTFNWDTKATGFDAGNTFRLFVWIGSTNVAYADVMLIPNAPPKNKKDFTDIALPDGRTMPIKVRVQQSWNCVNPTSCVTQVVTNTPPAGQTYTIVETADGRNAGFFPANWFDTKGGTINQVIVTFEDVTDQLSTANGGQGCGVGKTVMLSQEHCVRLTVDPKVIIATQPGNPAIVATCIDGITGLHQQLVKYDVNEVPEFLQNVSPPSPFVCHEGTETTGSTAQPSGVLGLASAAVKRFGQALKKFVTPNSAYAIDLGVGGGMGIGSECCSLISFGVAKTITNVSSLSRNGAAGGSLPSVVQITTVHDGAAGVSGQTVTCRVSSGGGTTDVAPTTDAKGITTCPWVLGEGGANTLEVTAQGIDDCTAFQPECDGVFAVQNSANGPVRVPLNRTVVFSAQAIAPSTLVNCSSDASGPDFIDRGFYIANYPGISLNSATLSFSADAEGDYTFALTAHRDAYNGPVIGVANATVSLANGRNSFTAGTFAFPRPYPAIDPNSTVTFSLTQVSGPTSQLAYYSVPRDGNAACPVTETEGTTPPRDTFRRNGVNIQIVGSAPPVVIE